MNSHPISRTLLTILGWVSIAAGVACIAIGVDGRYGPLAGYAGLAFGSIAGGAVMLGLGAIIDLLSDILGRAKRLTDAAIKAEAVAVGNCPECGTRRISGAAECRNCGYTFNR